jgi:RNA polymerase sigma factor (TIGR02999 family)
MPAAMTARRRHGRPPCVESAPVSPAPDEPRAREVTRLLAEGATSDQKAQLLPLVYDELHAIARRQMSAERREHTLQPTALVHEAFLRLVGDRGVSWEARSCFFVAAAEAMRRVLLDHARRRKADKRGGARGTSEPLTGLDLGVEADLDRALMVDEALGQLRKEDARAAQVVELRFFGGLDVDETATVLATSRRTVLREWAYARARLHQILGAPKP